MRKKDQFYTLHIKYLHEMFYMKMIYLKYVLYTNEVNNTRESALMKIYLKPRISFNHLINKLKKCHIIN